MSIAKYSQRSSNVTLVVQCAAHLKEQAEWLLMTLNKLTIENELLDSGIKERIGWSTLTLCRRGSEIMVCEPDFWGDPFRNVREDLTCTLTILAKQNKLLSILGIEGVPTTFDEKVTLDRNCLSAKQVCLKRERPEFQGDSGWYIRASKDPSPDDKQEVMYAYQLLDHRPELLQVLSLPPGYLAAFNGDSIDAIVNEKQEDVWNITDQAVGSSKHFRGPAPNRQHSGLRDK